MNNDLVARLQSIADAFGEMATMGNPFPLSFQNTVNEAISALRAHDAGQAGVVVSEGERALPVLAKWVVDLSSLGQLAELERRLSAVGVSMERFGEWFGHAAALQSPPQPPEPTGSLVGDALAAAGQSIGMSVTRVHPEPEKVGEAAEAEATWRDLALQFDGHRIEALSILRYVANAIDEYATTRAILREQLTTLKDFLAKPPLSGDEVLAQRIAATPPVADARRVEELTGEDYMRIMDAAAAAYEAGTPAGYRYSATALRKAVDAAFAARAALKGDSNGQ